MVLKNKKDNIGNSNKDWVDIHCMCTYAVNLRVCDMSPSKKYH